MCFKCCLTLSLHALWMLHDWWHKASALYSRCCNQTTAVFFNLSLRLAVFFILSFWMVLVICSSRASSFLLCIQVGALQLGRWQIEIGIADHMIQLCAPSRRTLTSWVELELVQWLCQCHLMFCLAVSVVCWEPLLMSLLAWQPWV